jgi:hypothetical protein
MFIKLNDLVVNDKHIIPLFARPRPFGIVNKLRAGPVGLGQRHLGAGYWYKDALSDPP